MDGVTQRRRVLYVGPLPPMRGGSGTVAGILLRGLRARGIVVRALAPLPELLVGAGGSEPCEARCEPWVQRYSVPTFSNLLVDGSSDHVYRAAESDGIAKRLPVLLDAVRPDVVLMGRESLAWHVPDIAAQWRVPTVLLVHGGATLAGILEGNGQFRDLRSQLRKIDLIIAVARHLATSLRRLGLTRVAVVDNPVDVNWFAPHPESATLRQALSIPAEATVVLHVSNLRSLKRPIDIVDAADIALRRDRNLCFVIVGDGALRSDMEDAVARLDRRPAFRFVGWVDHARVRDYINLADIVVMPSEHEGQSLVYLETQACGKVIVASDIPAAREVIVDGDTGLLFRTGVAADLATTIVTLAASPGLRSAIGVKARASVTSHASDVVVSKYERLLIGVANGRGCRVNAVRV
jgi:glycosyltransferase involved in cell wall biosynthesis